MKADDLRLQARCGEALIIKIFTIMTKEDKELLLKDMSARLPYGIKCKILETNEVKILGSIQHDGENTLFDFWENDQKTQYEYQLYLSEFKPYLFPLSSMTEEQRKEFYDVICWETSIGFSVDESCNQDIFLEKLIGSIKITLIIAI